MTQNEQKTRYIQDKKKRSKRKERWPKKGIFIYSWLEYYLLDQFRILRTPGIAFGLKIMPLDTYYDDMEILPSSSSFDKSYPQFYGDHTLPLQFLWNLLLEHVNPLWILTSDLRKFFVCFEQLVVGALSSLPEAELITKKCQKIFPNWNWFYMFYVFQQKISKKLLR